MSVLLCVDANLTTVWTRPPFVAFCFPLNRSLEQTLAAEQAQRRDDLVGRHQADSTLSKINNELARMREVDEIRRDRVRTKMSPCDNKKIPFVNACFCSVPRVYVLQEVSYKEKFEQEQARLLEAGQHEERLRVCLRDADSRLGRWNSEFFGNMPYCAEVRPRSCFFSLPASSVACWTHAVLASPHMSWCARLHRIANIVHSRRHVALQEVDVEPTEAFFMA